MNDIDRLYDPFILISACLNTNTPDQNKQATLKLSNILAINGYKFKKVEGCYKGSIEPSFYVSCPDFKTFVYLLSLASDLRQESILAVCKHRKASLIYVATNKKESIGVFKKCSKHMAINSDAYTYDIIHNTYYICE